jgi:hypothetical protein
MCYRMSTELRRIDLNSQHLIFIIWQDILEEPIQEELKAQINTHN